jgi:hypothetical protein
MQRTIRSCIVLLATVLVSTGIYLIVEQGPDYSTECIYRSLIDQQYIGDQVNHLVNVTINGTNYFATVYMDNYNYTVQEEYRCYLTLSGWIMSYYINTGMTGLGGFLIFLGFMCSIVLGVYVFICRESQYNTV